MDLGVAEFGLDLVHDGHGRDVRHVGGARRHLSHLGAGEKLSPFSRQKFKKILGVIFTTSGISRSGKCSHHKIAFLSLRQEEEEIDEGV